MGGQKSKAKAGSPFQGFLDDRFIKRATAIIDSYANDGGSLAHLDELMKFLVEVTLQTANAINSLKEEICGNRELYDLVKDFLNHSDATLAFFRELENRLRRARGNHSTLETVLQKFDGIKDGNGNVNVLSSALNDLRDFVRADNPFDKDFAELVQSTMQRHEEMSVKLTDRIKALDKKMKREKWWRNITCGLMGSVAVEYLVLAVVGSCVGIISVVGTAGLAAIAGVFTAGGVCTYIMYQKKQKELEKKRELVDTMRRANETTIAELKNIESLIESLKSKLEEMLKYGKVALSNSEHILVLKDLAEKLKKPVKDFNKTLNSLCEQVDECRNNIIAARNAVLKDKMMSSSQKQQLQTRK